MMNSKHKDKTASYPTCLIDRLSHDGRGIGTINGLTAFVQNALPGENVTVQLHQKRTAYYEGAAISRESDSPDRVTPPCPHFGVCGGCELQYIHEEKQLACKEQTLREQLTHFGKVTPHEWLKPLKGEQYGYRRKARLGIKYVFKKEKLLIGFREKSSRYLADLSECHILHPKIGKAFAALRECITALDTRNHIAQVEVAMGDTELALVFRHLEPLTQKDRAVLIQFGETHDMHIYLQPNAPHPIEKIWPDDKDYRLTYSLPEHDLSFAFHPLDFTQINHNINRALVNHALSLLDVTETDTVLDLFSGIGNFTLPIAKRAKTVIGIEGCQDMTARATENAKRNHIENAVFYTADLQNNTMPDVLNNLSIDKLLIDPPRSGAKEILQYVSKWRPKRIVYVSCNPATLARDAGLLVHEHGYHLQSAGIMDMFPQTAHVEAIAVFNASRSDDVRKNKQS